MACILSVVVNDGVCVTCVLRAYKTAPALQPELEPGNVRSQFDHRRTGWKCVRVDDDVGGDGAECCSHDAHPHARVSFEPSIRTSMTHTY